MMKLLCALQPSSWVALPTVALFLGSFLPSLKAADVPPLPAGGLDISSTTMEFEDQHGVNHRISFPLDKPMMITLAGQFGAAHVKKWIEPIAEDYLEPIHIVGIANLEGVPDFLKDPLRKGFQKNSAAWPILLDWEGVGFKTFGTPKNKISVCVVDTSGNVIWRYVGSPNKESLDSLKETINGLLSPPETESTQS